MPTERVAAGAAAACAGDPRLWLLQFFANPLVAALFAAWLLLPVGNAAELALNLLCAALLAAGAGVLLGGTLNRFASRAQGEERPMHREFSGALANLLAILLCLGAVYLAWTGAAKLAEYHEIFPAYVRSLLPAALRKVASLGFFERLFAAALFLLRWVVIPALALPFLAGAARGGLRGFPHGAKAWMKAVRSPAYWLVLLAAALAGVYATGKLMHWTPDFRTSTLRGETVSVVWRSLASYLLALASWMLACSVTGRFAGPAGDPAEDRVRETAA